MTDQTKITRDSDKSYQAAVHLVVTERNASTIFVQRRMSIGYDKAFRLITRMEEEGVVSSLDAKGRREILISPKGHGTRHFGPERIAHAIYRRRDAEG